MYDIIIIGAGPAGMTAAIYARRAAKTVLVLEALSYGGQIINTPDIENYPVEAHISGFDFSTKVYEQAKGLGARIRQRADALCEKYDLDPKIHGAAFRAAIKRDVLSGCGVKDPHDIPLRDLPLCMEQIDAWTSYALVRRRREIEKEAQGHGSAD